MKLNISYKKALGYLLSAFIISVFVFYFITTWKLISSRSLETVVDSTWYSTNLTVSFLNKTEGVIFDNQTTEKFDYIESNGYIYTYYSGTLDFDNTLPIYEFTNLGDRLYCSTTNIMFYNERSVNG